MSPATAAVLSPAESPPRSPSTPAAPRHPATTPLPAALLALTKPRITRMVALTAGVGFALSALTRGGDLTAMLLAAAGCLIGTALSSSGANALNQAMESPRDARMDRTRTRPIPAGDLARPAATLAGLALCAAGLVVLFFAAGPAAAAVSAVTMLIYLLVYTPLKPVTILNTWVGAIPGALPPLIGWCGAAWAAATPSPAAQRAPWTGLAEPGGWSLFALMACWQIPHFLAIAWMHKDDYARGGYRMLPIIDPTGRTTARQVILWSVILLPATLLPWLLLPERLSFLYAAVALVSGIAYISLAAGLARDHSRARARRVFLASVAHLPLLLLVLVADGLLTAFLRR